MSSADGERGAVATRVLPIASVTVFAAFVDVFALLPVIAPAARALGATDVAVGVTVGAYSASGLLGNLLGGWLADRLERRATAVAGLLGAAAALATYPLAGSVGALIAARLAHGLGGGVAVPALFAAAGDAATPGRRGPAMGRLGATIGLAAVVAPGAAGALRAAAGDDAVFLSVAAVIALAAGLAALLPARAGGSQAGAAEAGAAAAGTPGRAGEGASSPHGRAAGRAAIAAVFGFTVALGTLTGFLPDAVADRGGGPALPGAMLTGFSVVAVAVMLSPAMRRLDVGRLTAPLAGGCLVIAAAVAVVAATASVAVTAVAVMAVGLGFGAVFPAAATAMAAVPGVRRGRAFGRFHVAYGLGFVIGAPGAAALGSVLAVTPFAPAAAATAGCALVAGWWSRR